MPKRAWIETTHRSEDMRTEWRVVADGVVLQTGDVDDDLAGTLAYDAAQQWAQSNGVQLLGWKHAVDRGHLFDELQLQRARTTTDKSAPVRFYGYAICADSGEREGVAVTPQQMQDLESGALPCPVCGDGCGARLEPSADAKSSPLFWNGARWHGH